MRRLHAKLYNFRFVSLVLLFIPFTINGQTTYYVANNGNDANNGRSSATPFQNLTKVNNLALQAGDVVLFHRGDTFRGTLTIRKSGLANRPIIFDAYGNGEKPIFSGSVPVTNWSQESGSVWKASCPSCGNTVTGLYGNGVAFPLGRYPNFSDPNKGYLTIRAHTQKYQIFSLEHLPDNIDWQGGEVVMRDAQWIIDRAIIDHQYGDALNLINNSVYSPADGGGYFIQNHPAALDQPGEWAYDATNKTIRLFSSQVNPNDQVITATNQSRGVDIASSSNVIIRNLHITQTLNTNLFATNVSSFTLASTDITNAGEDGLTIQGTGGNIAIENNRILDVNNNGIWIDALQNVTIKGNSLRRIGMIPGRGKGGDGHYIGLQSVANQNVLIANNIIDSVGYNGVTFWNNTTIQQNIISNFCMAKSDGGALYVFNENQKASMTNIHLLSNILYNGIGAQEGSPRQDNYIGANGIFLDGCVSNVELKSNTIFNNSQYGIFLRGDFSISVTDNNVFNNSASQIVVYHNVSVCPVRNDVIKYNRFVSKSTSQLVGHYDSNMDDLVQYGQIDSNYYARPFDEEAIILGVINSVTGGYYSLNEWKTFSKGLDIHSKSSPITYKRFKNEGSGGKNRFYSTFDTNNNDWYVLYSNYNNAEATQDNTNKLDGGSLRVSFPTPSGNSNSYAQVINRFGAITKGKTYVLRFDAIASTNLNILVYLRMYGSPYTEYDKRYTVNINTSRKSYELPFIASDNNNDAVMIFQIDGEGPTFWLDNIRLQEDVRIQNNPDDFVKLFYNPTLKDSIITLTEPYRNVDYQAYRNSFVLKPFTSIILFKDTLPVPPADLALSLQSDKLVLKVNEPTTMRLRVSNQSNTLAALARWTYRLPPNLQFANDGNTPYDDNVLTGTIQNLAPLTDTVFTFSVKPTTAGLFRTAAQITTATSPDPDSYPNSGTADGEDDAAIVELRVDGPASGIYESPNPNQRTLPVVLSIQPIPDPAQADLSLRMELSNLAPTVGSVITCTLYISNAGGTTANEVQLENQLPDGFQLVNAPSWTSNGQLINTTLAAIPAGTTLSTSFQMQIISPGTWINRAQISGSNIADPDSIPGNGFENGEDDQTQAYGRSQ